jgi:hypothetical protein
MSPSAFLGATILCHGFLNAFPLPPMSKLPILVQISGPVAGPPPPCFTCSPSYLAP